MDMPNQILPFVCPEFSAIIEMSRHFFSWTNGKDFIRDTLKGLEIVRTTFKWKLYFLNDDNLTTALCLVYIQLHQSITSLLIDIKSWKSNKMAKKWTYNDQLLSFIRHLSKVICICNPCWCIWRILGPLQHLRWSMLWQEK